MLHAVTEVLAAHGHAFQMLVGLVPGGVRLLEGLTEATRDRLMAALASGDCSSPWR